MLRSIRSAKAPRKLVAGVAVAGSLGLLGAGPQIASADAAYRSCPGTTHTTIRANSVTSCAFARNIARSFESAVSDGDVDPWADDTARGVVYSPATGREYTVRCYNRGGYGAPRWSCSGGNGANVRLTWYA